MRVVVDTNIFISAVLKPTSVPYLAMQLVQRNDRLLKSAITEDELRRMLARPLFADYFQASTRAWVEHVMNAAEMMLIAEPIRACRDEKDDMFLELAIKGHADLIISGDADLLSMTPFRDVPIITPAAFVSARRS